MRNSLFYFILFIFSYFGRIKGTCADNDAAVISAVGSDCATLAAGGYCGTHFCTACSYAGYCDESCGFCATPSPSPLPTAAPSPAPNTAPSPIPTPVPSPSCVDNDAEVISAVGSDCATLAAGGYCGTYFCTACSYAGYCDESCGFCATPSPSPLPTALSSPTPPVDNNSTIVYVSTFSELQVAVPDGHGPQNTAEIHATANMTFSSPIFIPSSVTVSLTAAASDGIVFSGGGATRLFHVYGALHVSHVMIRDGYVPLSSAWDENFQNQGGAILAYCGSETRGNLTVDDATFHSNSAYNGGAIASRLQGSPTLATALTLRRSVFHDNYAENSAGAIYPNAQPHMRKPKGLYATVLDCNFHSNTAQSGGGALAATSLIVATVQGSTFRSNFASGAGGAIYYNGDYNGSTSPTSYIEFSRCLFSDNTAITAGGAITIYSGKVIVKDGTVWDGNFAAYGNDGYMLDDSGFSELDCESVCPVLSGDIDAGCTRILFSGAGATCYSCTCHFPSAAPSAAPSPVPSKVPTPLPSASPAPSHFPSPVPSSAPTTHPSPPPSPFPSPLPSPSPTSEWCTSAPTSSVDYCESFLDGLCLVTNQSCTTRGGSFDASLCGGGGSGGGSCGCCTSLAEPTGLPTPTPSPAPTPAPSPRPKLTTIPDVLELSATKPMNATGTVYLVNPDRDVSQIWSIEYDNGTLCAESSVHIAPKSSTLEPSGMLPITVSVSSSGLRPGGNNYARFTIQIQTPQSDFIVDESLVVHMAVSTKADVAMTNVQIKSNPVLGEAWQGVNVCPRDADGFEVLGYGSDFMFILKQHEALSTMCKVAYGNDEGCHAVECQVPTSNDASGWGIVGSLDGEEFYSSALHARCPASFYEDDERTCQDCPLGGECAAGSTTSTLQVKQGWWRSDETSADIRQCQSGKAACTGGNRSSCSKGYTGALCAECEENFYLGWTDSECTSCGNGHTTTVVVLVLFFVVLLAAFAFAYYYFFHVVDISNSFQLERLQALYEVSNVKVFILVLTGQARADCYV